MSYINKKIESQLKNIEVLTTSKKFHELELRFGKLGNFFQSNLGKPVFEKIFNQLMKNEEKIINEIIIDYIFNNHSKYNFLDKRDYNLKQSKFMKKITHEGDFKTPTEDFAFDKYNSIDDEEKYKIEHSLKEKKTTHTKDYTRYSYSLEYEIDILKHGDIELLHKSSKPFETIRFKNRYSRQLNDFLRLDMTIVKTIDPYTFEEIQDEIEYIVEIEIINKSNIEELLKSLQTFSRNIVNQYFNKEEFLFNLATMNPATMEKKDLSKLKKHKYTVTDKADGERIFMIFFDGMVYLYNPKTNQKIYSFPNPTINDKKPVEDTVIDGEYLADDITGKYEYLAFDLLLFRNKDYRDKNLKRRLEVLKYISDKYFPMIKDVESKIKTFYYDDIFENAKKIWENKGTRFTYELDGLIFTPIDQVYTSDKQTIPVLKWKEALSIDVRVEYSFKENFTYFHHGSMNKNNRRPWNLRPHRNLERNPNYYEQFDKEIDHLRWVTNDKDIVNNIDTLNIGKINNGKLFLGMEGAPQTNSEIRPIWSKYDIIEFEYDFELNQWIAIRKRTFDKEKANAKRTIESVVKSIINYISLKELYDLKHKNLENVGALYDETDDTKRRKQWRNFHGFVKGEVYKKTADMIGKRDNYHLELACGKLGDLKKWQKEGYKNILAIDISKDHIYDKRGAVDRLIGAGFKKVDYYYEKDGLKITPIYGDVTKNIRNGNSALTDEDKLKLQKFLDDLPEDFEGFNTIGIMFAIHYLFGTNEGNDKKIYRPLKSQFEGFMKNLTENLRYDGIVMGTYLNGSNMTEEDMSFIHNGDEIYHIEHLLNKPVAKNITYDKFFKKKEINSILIKNEVWGDNVKIAEPQINKDILNMVFKKFNMKPLEENTTFSQHYPRFQKVFKKDLGVGEKKLSFINNTFMFGYINTDKMILELNELLETNIYNKQEIVAYIRENISNGNLDGKVKQIYKVLMK